MRQAVSRTRAIVSQLSLLVSFSILLEDSVNSRISSFVSLSNPGGEYAKDQPQRLRLFARMVVGAV